MGFQRQYVFQKRFLHLGIAVAHPAIYHFTAGNVRDFTAKLLHPDFPVNRIKAERVVGGFMVRDEASMANCSDKESPHRAGYYFTLFKV
jgi:hypothetical protein